MFIITAYEQRIIDKITADGPMPEDQIHVPGVGRTTEELHNALLRLEKFGQIKGNPDGTWEVVTP